MAEARPSQASADQNLLFGILALQLEFIHRDALVAAMNAWVLNKSRPLGQILCEQGSLGEEEHALLDALVRKHLERHGKDPGKSLAAVSSIGSFPDQLQEIADPDLHASLATLAGRPPGQADRPGTPGPSAASANDLYATLAPSAVSRPGSGPRYRILRPHAKGGLGEVFVAEDQELHREVALKEIQDRHAHNAESRARFLLEAEITGGLEHPGIVPVYGLGQYADGRPFYAMRFIRGDSLQDAINRFHQADVPGRDPGEPTLSLRQLLRRFIDVCNAIAYAHSRGVLDRDLKPGNVMLGQYGETLVVDWGLAKPLSQREHRTDGGEPTLLPHARSELGMTQMGQILGTPAYMSPEQAAGRLEQLGPTSDVYSLGAILYCLLTGRPPYLETSLERTLVQVQLGEFPPPRQVKPEVSGALEAICLRAMSLSPADRYSSPRELYFTRPGLAHLQRFGS
jgi:hypothetical protein